ncbi:MAG: type II toxin-antitoxin system Phd/YefM family antitoxin [Chloroflexi bacterium]|nr:type II toxin-antitoxin system Phd/YefM family antitoxin [Chloroflexota bacterium]
MHQVDIHEAKTHLPDLVEEAMSGVEVVITRENQPLVKLVPLLPSKPRPQFGSAKGLITMSEGFDEPLEDFKAYMQ